MTSAQALLAGIAVVAAFNLALVLFFHGARSRASRIPHHTSHQSPKATLSKAKAEVGDENHEHGDRR